MRIIAGEFRGRKLLAPESDTTRPITDRAKQSLFDVLTPLIPDAIAYDCFAGTGSMGLECLSRGAAKAVFFERDRSALQRLGKNIETLGVKGRSIVSSGDIFRSFANANLAAQWGLADLVFLDPPYRFLNEQPDQLRSLAAQMVTNYLKPDGIIIFRHDAADVLELPKLTRYDLREYGQMTIELLRRQDE